MISNLFQVTVSKTLKMVSSIAIVEDAGTVAAAAFRQDEEGRVLFGFCGRSPEPLPVDTALESPLVIHDYLMERGVKYSVRLVSCGSGTTLEISDSPSDRRNEVLWFTRKHLVACGLHLNEGNDGV